MTQYGFFFDESRCYDCRACSMACTSWNGREPGEPKLLRRFTWEEGTFPAVAMHSLFAPCYHCENPACVPACPNGAIVKEDKYGAVLVDEELCTGCGTCWNACPFGAPQYKEKEGHKVMSKCTMCVERLEAGKMPNCVTACQTRALDFGPIDELIAKYGELRALDAMPDDRGTKPSIVFKPVAPKVKVVPYDDDYARKLFSTSQDGTVWYEEGKVGCDGDGAILKNKLDMKATDPAKAAEAMRSDEF